MQEATQEPLPCDHELLWGLDPLGEHPSIGTCKLCGREFFKYDPEAH